MDLVYWTVGRYVNYDPLKPPGVLNPGGGFPTKTAMLREVWNDFYRTGITEHPAAYPEASILVVEPIWFRLRGSDLGDLYTPDLEMAVSEYEKYSAKIKIVYATEFAFMKLPRAYRDRIVGCSSVVTSCCPYQRGLFDMLGIPTSPLCDPISDVWFYHPEIQKELSVFGMSHISSNKNSQKVVEVFQALRDKPIKKVYIGDAALWGRRNMNREGKRLEKEIRKVADVFYESVPPVELGQILGGLSLGIFDTFHDTASFSNIESLMSGAVCLYGLHGAWEGRPGFHNLDTVDDFVGCLARLTDDFTCLPAKEYVDQARAWAVENHGVYRFREDWSKLLNILKA